MRIPQLERVSLPITRAYFITAEKIVPGKHALLRNIEWYEAGTDMYFAPGTSLFKKDIVVTEANKRTLLSRVPAGKAVLVGDLRDNHTEVPASGTLVNKIMNHMEERRALLFRKIIIPDKESAYPSLLEMKSLFHPERHRCTPAETTSYVNRTNIRVILAFDGTHPEVFADPSQPRNYMGHAIATAEEFTFQQKYFFGSDQLSVVVYGESSKDIDEKNISRSAVWKVGRVRDTAGCLEHCIDIALHRGGYTHIYLFTTGASEVPPSPP